VIFFWSEGGLRLSVAPPDRTGSAENAVSANGDFGPEIPDSRYRRRIFCRRDLKFEISGQGFEI
jgi:hypothetical protein